MDKDIPNLLLLNGVIAMGYDVSKPDYPMPTFIGVRSIVFWRHLSYPGKIFAYFLQAHRYGVLA